MCGPSGRQVNKIYISIYIICKKTIVTSVIFCIEAYNNNPNPILLTYTKTSYIVDDVNNGDLKYLNYFVFSLLFCTLV